jgi:hypothetical protein
VRPYLYCVEKMSIFIRKALFLTATESSIPKQNKQIFITFGFSSYIDAVQEDELTKWLRSSSSDCKK